MNNNKWGFMIEWFSFNDAVIRRIGYDTVMNTMYIDFHGSEVDQPYCGIPEKLFRRFVAAKSLTKFYNENIKNIYECQMVY